MTRATRREFLRGLGAVAALGGAAAGGAVPAAAQAKIKPGAEDVLIVVDVQNCFVPGGTRPVKDGDEIIPLVNRLARGFLNVILTQDWHMPGHISFASSHLGKKPLDTVQLPYGTQVLWPDHCIQGTKDAELDPRLSIAHAQLIIRKGYRQHVDSYSAFFEADGQTPTGLAGYLRERRLKQVFFVGLAADFCVASSALDARKAGFAALVVEDATRGIDLGGSLGKAWADMAGAGVKRIQSRDLDV